MSESESYPKAEFFRKPNLSEYLPNVPKCGLNTRHDNREVTLIHLTWAHTLRSDKCATGSIHANGSMTINVIPCSLFYRSGLYLVPSAIHLRSKLKATIILITGSTIHWALRRIFVKFFVYLMMTNIVVKTCLNQKIIKNSNLIQSMKNSVCPKAKVIRRPNFSESRICPNVPKCGLNTRHDNREVTLIHLTRAQTLHSDKCATGSIHANGSMTINIIPC